jgi:hypothetical protein
VWKYEHMIVTLCPIVKDEISTRHVIQSDTAHWEPGAADEMRACLQRLRAGEQSVPYRIPDAVTVGLSLDTATPSPAGRAFIVMFGKDTKGQIAGAICIPVRSEDTRQEITTFLSPVVGRKTAGRVVGWALEQAPAVVLVPYGSMESRDAVLQYGGLTAVAFGAVMLEETTG